MRIVFLVSLSPIAWDILEMLGLVLEDTMVYFSEIDMPGIDNQPPRILIISHPFNTIVYQIQHFD